MCLALRLRDERRTRSLQESRRMRRAGLMRYPCVTFSAHSLVYEIDRPRRDGCDRQESIPAVQRTAVTRGEIARVQPPLDSPGGRAVGEGENVVGVGRDY